MEKLDPSKQESIKKMSSIRLSAKLLEAGVDETIIQAMDRVQMITAYAELVAYGTDKPPISTGPIGYDPELERQRLDFEIRKYEEEREERKQREEIEAETQRRAEDFSERQLALQEKEFEEAKRKAIAEKEERQKKHQEEMQLKQRELEMQAERDWANKSLVSKTKVFADALKGTIPRMPADVIHLLTYFRDVERLFDRFEVPEELKAHLLRPYLNEKGKILVSRMDPNKSNDYKAVKEMLLREFKLSPSVYLDKFNTDVRKQDETYLLYSARLAAILDAYLDSRKIGKSYDKLTELLICDKIKSTLQEGCLKYILAIESSKEAGWLSVHELAEAIDLYYANRHQGDRPRAGALGLPSTTRPTGGGGGRHPARLIHLSNHLLAQKVARQVMQNRRLL